MFLQKSFIGKNKWYLYLLVLVLVFVLAQVGGIPFAVYAMMTNLDAVQAGDTAALSQVRDTAGLALMLFSFAVGLLALVVFARIFQGNALWTIPPGGGAGTCAVSGSAFWYGAFW